MSEPRRYTRALVAGLLALVAVVGLVPLASDAHAAPDALPAAARDALDLLSFRDAIVVPPTLDAAQVAAASTDGPRLEAMSAQLAATRALVDQLGAVAGQVAPRAGVDAAALQASWAFTSPERLRVVLTGLSAVGSPYRYTRSGPDAFDCSGLTSYAWRAVGRELPHQSGAQARLRRVALADAEPGDIVWRPGHVMLYLGVGDAVVHAPGRGRRVQVDDMGRVSRVVSPG